MTFLPVAITKHLLHKPQSKQRTIEKHNQMFDNLLFWRYVNSHHIEDTVSPIVLRHYQSEGCIEEQNHMLM
jgi:hypothetical protein